MLFTELSKRSTNYVALSPPLYSAGNWDLESLERLLQSHTARKCECQTLFNFSQTFNVAHSSGWLWPWGGKRLQTSERATGLTLHNLTKRRSAPSREHAPVPSQPPHQAGRREESRAGCRANGEGSPTEGRAEEALYPHLKPSVWARPRRRTGHLCAPRPGSVRVHVMGWPVRGCDLDGEKKEWAVLVFPNICYEFWVSWKATSWLCRERRQTGC